MRLAFCDGTALRLPEVLRPPGARPSLMPLPPPSLPPPPPPLAAAATYKPPAGNSDCTANLATRKLRQQRAAPKLRLSRNTLIKKYVPGISLIKKYGTLDSTEQHQTDAEMCCLLIVFTM